MARIRSLVGVEGPEPDAVTEAVKAVTEGIPPELAGPLAVLTSQLEFLEKHKAVAGPVFEDLQQKRLKHVRAKQSQKAKEKLLRKLILRQKAAEKISAQTEECQRKAKEAEAELKEAEAAQAAAAEAAAAAEQGSQQLGREAARKAAEEQTAQAAEKLEKRREAEKKAREKEKKAEDATRAALEASQKGRKADRTTLASKTNYDGEGRLMVKPRGKGNLVWACKTKSFLKNAMHTPVRVPGPLLAIILSFKFILFCFALVDFWSSQEAWASFFGDTLTAAAGAWDEVHPQGALSLGDRGRLVGMVLKRVLDIYADMYPRHAHQDVRAERKLVDLYEVYESAPVESAPVVSPVVSQAAAGGASGSGRSQERTLLRQLPQQGRNSVLHQDAPREQYLWRERGSSGGGQLGAAAEQGSQQLVEETYGQDIGLENNRAKNNTARGERIRRRAAEAEAAAAAKRARVQKKGKGPATSSFIDDAAAGSDENA
jgi:hypothetical protein